MPNHNYSHQSPPSSHRHTAARSTSDTPSYYPDYPSLYSSDASYYSRYRTPLSSIDILSTNPSSSTPITFFPASTSSSSYWPSFDRSSSAFAKRPYQALYDQSVQHAHMFEQNDAWLTSDSLAKRPKLESASNLPYHPQRPGEKDCTHYMLTRTCKFGDNCKFDHPIWVPAGGIPDWKEPPSVPSETHPERPGEPDCPYYLKTQKCKFGLQCKFNHPKNKLDPSGNTDAEDLPERPSEPLCSFYMKTGICKFRTSCKFHHPKDVQVLSDGQEAVNGAQSHPTDHVDATATGDGNAVKRLSSNPAHTCNSKGLPIRLGEVNCPFYMKTGSCKYGVNCRYNHPDWNVINPSAAVVGHAVLPSLANNAGLQTATILQGLQPWLGQSTLGGIPVIYPQRPGQMECDYYMKSGECKFGEKCKFHHPIDRAAPTRNQSLEQNVKLTLAGFPRREGAEHCPFYMKTGTCRYGANCKFDHPPPGEVLASAEKETPTKAEEQGKENGEKGEEEKSEDDQKAEK